jgi:hypothetical protein
VSWSRGLQPWLRPHAEALVSHLRGQVRVTNTYRSRSQQLYLWNNRHRNPYPVAPPGTSKHEQGRAWDMVGPPEVLQWAGKVWRSWGGRWFESDPIHFEA